MLDLLFITSNWFIPCHATVAQIFYNENMQTLEWTKYVSSIHILLNSLTANYFRINYALLAVSNHVICLVYRIIYSEYVTAFVALKRWTKHKRFFRFRCVNNIIGRVSIPNVCHMRSLGMKLCIYHKIWHVTKEWGKSYLKLEKCPKTI